MIPSTPGLRLENILDCFERLVNVIDDVIRILNPACKPDKPVSNSQIHSRLQRLIKVSHNTHLLHQRFSASKARSNIRNFQRVNEPIGGIERRLFKGGSGNLKRQNSAPMPALLLLCRLVIWMIRNSWVPNSRDFWVVKQERREFFSTTILLLYSQIQRLHSTNQKVGSVGIYNTSQNAVQSSYFRYQVGTPSKSTAEYVIVAGKVLCTGVDNEIRTHHHRFAVHRSREGCVNDAYHVVLLT
mmetsp:Transcript_17134/g.24563  ORF Transcript_17134/g.24563 Transcript_17134/m.24563 type:complete len:242 (-) Transcript_17134:2-727(-)